ncbi:hypothetical protein [Anaerovibrio sp. RM50]|uniref:hypothetical protein n=1 Tax=Anaerovibrio sp. RM50 TaxID=1200557 RepID=UPI000481C234|nr:hypothetical protein [Anaerovibrio sp. RM50]
MAKQDINKKLTKKQKNILNLEKKYFKYLEEIIQSDEFLGDLLKIEREIRHNYHSFLIWKKNNKLDTVAERLISYHIYKKFYDDLKGIYPSPICSDLGIILTDCTLCVDAKTVDVDANKSDVTNPCVEPNQNSFDNSNHPYFKAKGNIETYEHYSRLPVLTYLIRILYTDDGIKFSLIHGDNDSIMLACIPNGELSNLFDYDIIAGFKTYSYYNGKDDDYYKPHFIPNNIKKDASILKHIRKYCEDKGWVEYSIPLSNNQIKYIYHDANRGIYWTLVEGRNGKRLQAIKEVNTARIDHNIISERYDGNNNVWCGYAGYSIPEAQE